MELEPGRAARRTPSWPANFTRRLQLALPTAAPKGREFDHDEADPDYGGTQTKVTRFKTWTASG